MKSGPDKCYVSHLVVGIVRESYVLARHVLDLNFELI